MVSDLLQDCYLKRYICCKQGPEPLCLTTRSYGCGGNERFILSEAIQVDVSCGP